MTPAPTHEAPYRRGVGMMLLNADGLVLVARRAGMNDRHWQMPQGGIDAGESPRLAALRELEEETGYVANELIHLGRFASSSGLSNEELDLFVARDPEPGGNLRRENTEQMEIELIALDELERMALSGEIKDAPSVLGILLAAQHLKQS